MEDMRQSPSTINGVLDGISQQRGDLGQSQLKKFLCRSFEAQQGLRPRVHGQVAILLA